MFVLGLILLGAVAAFTGLLISENVSGGPDYTVTMFDNTLATVNTLAAFLAGLALALLFGLALVMVRAGAAGGRHRRARLHAARREAELARKERDALAAILPEDREEEAPAAPATQASKRHHRRRHLFGH
jgi:hypothetical protein